MGYSEIFQHIYTVQTITSLSISLSFCLQPTSSSSLVHYAEYNILLGTTVVPLQCGALGLVTYS